MGPLILGKNKWWSDTHGFIEVDVNKDIIKQLNQYDKSTLLKVSNEIFCDPLSDNPKTKKDIIPLLAEYIELEMSDREAE